MTTEQQHDTEFAQAWQRASCVRLERCGDTTTMLSVTFYDAQGQPGLVLRANHNTVMLNHMLLPKRWLVREHVPEPLPDALAPLRALPQHSGFRESVELDEGVYTVQWGRRVCCVLGFEAGAFRQATVFDYTAGKRQCTHCETWEQTLDLLKEACV